MDYALVRTSLLSYTWNTSLINATLFFSHIDWHLNRSVFRTVFCTEALTIIYSGLAIVLAEDVPGIEELDPPGKSIDLSFLFLDLT